MIGPLAQTVSDSGVWGVAGGEGAHREKTGPSLKYLGPKGGADLPPQGDVHWRYPEGPGPGGNLNLAHSADWA